MSETRTERRARELAARKAATKARLAAPATPPQVPVALPWQRRPRRARAVHIDRELPEMSLLMSGSAADLYGSLAAAASMTRWVSHALKGSR